MEFYEVKPGVMRECHHPDIFSRHQSSAVSGERELTWAGIVALTYSVSIASRGHCGSLELVGDRKTALSMSSGGAHHTNMTAETRAQKHKLSCRAAVGSVIPSPWLGSRLAWILTLDLYCLM